MSHHQNFGGENRLIYFNSDEFADVKAVKLLRRGRRLQQVEYVLHFPPPVMFNG